MEAREELMVCQRACLTAAHRCLGKRTLRRHAVYVQRPCLLIVIYLKFKDFTVKFRLQTGQGASQRLVGIGCLTAMNELQRLQPVKPIVYGSMSVFCAGFLFV